MTKQTAEIRAEKLKSILKKLENGEHVQNRTLQTWLTDDEFKAMQDMWDDQIELRKVLKDKPDEIIEYEKRLRKATFAYNKADNHSYKRHRAATKKGFNNSDSEFESLIEYLKDILYADPDLAEWFDREISFDFDSTPSLEPIGMPRTITSRSLDRQSSHPRKMSKIEIKIFSVSQAIHNIENDSAYTSDNKKTLIKKKLKDLKKKIK